MSACQWRLWLRWQFRMARMSASDPGRWTLEASGRWTGSLRQGLKQILRTLYILCHILSSSTLTWSPKYHIISLPNLCWVNIILTIFNHQKKKNFIIQSQSIHFMQQQLEIDYFQIYFEFIRLRWSCLIFVRDLRVWLFYKIYISY